MKPQHEFPKEWGDISTEEAKKHIEYLLEHYQEYDDITVWGRNKNCITINRITFIIMRPQEHYRFYMVNMKKAFYSREHQEIMDLIDKLVTVCTQEVDKRQEQEVNKRKQEKANRKQEKEKTQKEEDKIQKSINIIGTIVLVAGFCAIMGYMTWDIYKQDKKERIKQNKIENEIKRYEKTLPYYNEYLQTKQQIQNRRDSLEKVYGTAD